MRTAMRSSLTLVTAMATLALASAAIASPTATTSRYVALGDSFTSGPLIPNQRLDSLGCLRSDHNYPALLAARLKVGTFVDASCSGAQTTDMTAAQQLTIPGQT